MYKQTQPTKLWNCCWCPACCIKRASGAAVRAHNSPTCGFHILGSEYSPVSSCGSAELQFGSCCAGGHHGWTRAALRLACASLSSSGSHSLEDLWFDQQEKEVSPKTNKYKTRAKSHILLAECKWNNSEWEDDYHCHPLNKNRPNFTLIKILRLPWGTGPAVKDQIIIALKSPIQMNPRWKFNLPRKL